MKKFACVVLALILALSSVLWVTAFAEEKTKTDTLLDEILETKSVRIALDDKTFDTPVIKNVVINAKLTEKDGKADAKVAGELELAGKKLKAIYDEGNIDAYFFIFRVNLTKLLGDSLGLEDIFAEVGSVLNEVSAYRDFIKYDSTAEVNLGRNYGTVTAEKYVPDLDALVAAYNEQNPENAIEMNGWTEETILAEFDKYPDTKILADIYRNIAAEFYYKDNALVGVKVTMPDENGRIETIDTTMADIVIKGITSNVDDSAFKAPFIAINITGLFNLLFGKLLAVA